MITCISGLPGKGKNVYATYLAKKHYRSQNHLLKKMIRRIKHQDTLVNNVYTSYPILLDKKRKIYSNIVSMYDLNNKYRFQENALIIIDEVQSFFDSDEYKVFPKSIAIFNQFHRHFGIKDIYYITQHPSRLIKKVRDLCCRFVKIRKFIVLPFVHIAIMYFTNYYEFDDYGRWHHPSKEMKTYDVDNHFKIFRVKPIFKSYFSKYLSVLNKDKPLYDKGSFINTYMSSEDITAIFGDYVFKERKEPKR